MLFQSDIPGFLRLRIHLFEGKVEVPAILDHLHFINMLLLAVQHCCPCTLQVVVGVDGAFRNPKCVSRWNHEPCQLKFRLCLIQELAHHEDALPWEMARVPIFTQRWSVSVAERVSLQRCTPRSFWLP